MTVETVDRIDVKFEGLVLLWVEGCPPAQVCRGSSNRSRGGVVQALR